MTPGSEDAAADLVVLRVALAPRLTTWSRTDAREPGDRERLRELAGIFAGDPALELASPDLADALRRPLPDDAKHRRRMTLALTGYLLRARHRATPFGMFAGTALIHRGPCADGTIGNRHQVFLRPSPAWVAGLVAGLVADPGMVTGLRVATAPSLRRAAGRHVLIDTAHGGPGRWRADKIVARSALLDAVAALADGGIAYSSLADLLCAAAPRLGREEVASYVARLLSERLLVCDAEPPPGEPDPLGAVIGRIPRHRLAARLDALRSDLREAPAAGDLRRLRARLRALGKDDAGLVADTVAGTDLRLPDPVVGEVERAASVAWECGRGGPDRSLAGLQRALLDRYGPGTPVPLTELLDPAGSPRGGGHAAAPAAITHGARDQLLTGLAMAPGRAEVVVSRRLRHRLAALSPDPGPRPCVDIVAEVITACEKALNDGDFLVSVGSRAATGPAGSSAGRLAPYLGPAAAALAARDPFDVEVVFRPPDPSAANLVAETGWTDYRIDLTRPACWPTGRDLPLTDLFVIATRAGVRLYSQRLGHDIRPVTFSALDPRHAGAIAGLLLALGRDGSPQWRSWDWGAASTLEWLPRVRTGRVILSPARWTLPPRLLHLAVTGNELQWRSELARWRDAERVPCVVMAGAWDRRVPLDLADPVHAALLRRECRGNRVVRIFEPPGGVTAWRAAGWPSGEDGPHTAEFVISLNPRPAKPANERRQAPPGAARDRGLRGSPPGQTEPATVFLPGGTWLCASLAVPATLQDCVLTELDLASAIRKAGVDRWFYVRTATEDGQQAIVIRFHGPADGLARQLGPALHAWCRDLRAAGLIGDLSLVSYRPELWRYGCIEAAERFFCHDSRLCLAALAAPGDLRPEELAVPGVLGILSVMLGSADAVREMPGPRLSPAERRLFTRLRPSVRGSDGGADRSALPEWNAALAAYRRELAGMGRDPAPVALSLVHMHCNRLAGPNDPAERVAVALARDLVLTRSAQAR